MKLIDVIFLGAVVMGIAFLGVRMVEKRAQREAMEVVLIRSYVTTNFIPGYVSEPATEWKVDTNGWILPKISSAIAVHHSPRNEVVTNYVLGVKSGTNSLELWTVEKR